MKCIEHSPQPQEGARSFGKRRVSAGVSIGASRSEKMAKRRGSSDSGRRTRSKAAEERRDESIQRLDKLPQELWEKILDELDENDLFPLALSCRRFRQKQKELVARQSRRESGKPRLTLKTKLRSWPSGSQPASADYLRFCSKQKGRNEIVRRLAAFHGHLPLLQELLKTSNNLPHSITNAAGESSFSQSLCLLCRDF